MDWIRAHSMDYFGGLCQRRTNTSACVLVLHQSAPKVPLRPWTQSTVAPYGAIGHGSQNPIHEENTVEANRGIKSW
jgi:hypothetical protein